MYEYSPPQNKKAALSAAFACLLPGALLIMPPRSLSPLLFSSLSCVGIALSVLGLFIFFRFFLTSFTYRLEYLDSGSIDFTIICRTGKRLRTVCRVSSDTFISLYDPSRKKELKKLSPDAKYSYQPFTFKPYTLCLHEDEKTVCIRFLPDKKLASLILQLIDNKNIR